MTPATIQEELQACHEALAVMEDRWKRAAAELDNYRKRYDRELARMRQLDREALLRDWLEVVDNLERALESQEAVTAGSLREGLRMLYQQALTVLGQHGVQRMQTRGEPFDPAHHEAVAQIPGSPEGTILEEFKPGYQLGDTTLRPAKVIVAKPAEHEGGGDGI